MTFLGHHEDPVCTLEKSKLIQVCSSVVNSSYFDDMVVRSFTAERITACNREKLSFMNREFAYTRPTQEELMVNCHIELENKRTKKTFEVFVSRGDSRDHFFVYSFSVGKLYLLNLSTNIVQYYMHNV